MLAGKVFCCTFAVPNNERGFEAKDGLDSSLKA